MGFKVQNQQGEWIKDIYLDDNGKWVYVYTDKEDEAHTFNPKLLSRWLNEPGYTVVQLTPNQPLRLAA